MTDFVGADVDRLDADADRLARLADRIDEQATWFRSTAALAGFTGDDQSAAVGAADEQFDQFAGILRVTGSILEFTRDGLLGVPYNTSGAIEFALVRLELATLGIEPDEQGHIDLLVAENRIRIQDDLATETDPERRALLQSWLDPYTDPLTGLQVVPQILLYDGATNQVAIAFGDITDADFVSIAVPGTGTDPSAYRLGDSMGGEATRALRLQRFMGLASNESVATIAWLGYDAPKWAISNNPGQSGSGIEGGHSLTEFHDSLDFDADQRITVLGHSYGSYVVGEALKDGLDVDNVIVMGSPGMGVNHVNDFGLDDDTDVFAMRADADPVGTLERFGTSPTSPFFGATRLEATAETFGFSHSDYWSDPNIIQLAEAATDGTPEVDVWPTAGEMLGEATVFVNRVSEDVVDFVQQPLPEFAENWVDGAQTVSRTAFGTVGTVVTEVTDVAIDGAARTASGIADKVEDAWDWLNG